MLSETKLIVLDVETTGLSPAMGDRVIELGTRNNHLPGNDRDPPCRCSIHCMNASLRFYQPLPVAGLAQIVPRFGQALEDIPAQRGVKCAEQISLLFR